jgi:hypothetical protein
MRAAQGGVISTACERRVPEGDPVRVGSTWSGLVLAFRLADERAAVLRPAGQSEAMAARTDRHGDLAAERPTTAEIIIPHSRNRTRRRVSRITIQPRRFAQTEGIHQQLSGSILTAGTFTCQPQLKPFFRTTPLLTKLPKDISKVDTVLIGQPQCRTLVDPTIRAFVATNMHTAALHLIRTDRLLLVYVVSGVLHPPTQAEIKAQPLGRLSDHC